MYCVNFIFILHVYCVWCLTLNGLNFVFYYNFSVQGRRSGCRRKEARRDKESCPHVCRPTSRLQERTSSAVRECGVVDARSHLPPALSFEVTRCYKRRDGDQTVFNSDALQAAEKFVARLQASMERSESRLFSVMDNKMRFAFFLQSRQLEGLFSFLYINRHDVIQMSCILVK